mmetsp:Transcript_3963/g.11480  ORF Transcript_3963/g.11480 Transcript_3963/m.11480 type:complete len:337 (+) Transcript_3963:468-1478(+)
MLQHLMELALVLAGPTAVDEVGAYDRQLAPRREQQGFAAVYRVRVASEHADLAIRVLRPYEPYLIPVWLDRRRAEERGVCGIDSGHGVGQLGRRVFGRRCVHPAVEVLATALERQAVIRAVATPLVNVVATLVAEDEITSARSARHPTFRLFFVHGEFVLLELLEAGVVGQALVPIWVLVDADLDIPHDMRVAHGAGLRIHASRRRGRPALLIVGEVPQRLVLARVPGLTASGTCPTPSAALRPLLVAIRRREVQGPPRRRNRLEALGRRVVADDERRHAAADDARGEHPPIPPINVAVGRRRRRNDALLVHLTNEMTLRETGVDVLAHAAAGSRY